MNKPLEYYLSGTYHVQVSSQHAGGERWIYVAQCISMPGCLSQADSEAEAREHLAQILPQFLTVMHREGVPLPEPDVPGVDG